MVIIDYVPISLIEIILCDLSSIDHEPDISTVSINIRLEGGHEKYVIWVY